MRLRQPKASVERVTTAGTIQRRSAPPNHGEVGTGHRDRARPRDGEERRNGNWWGQGREGGRERGREGGRKRGREGLIPGHETQEDNNLETLPFLLSSSQRRQLRGCRGNLCFGHSYQDLDELIARDLLV